MILKTSSNFNSGFVSFATGTGIFAIYFMISSMTLAAPVIAGLYHLQPQVTGFIIQAHLIGAVLFLLPAAKFGDLVGHGKILCAGGFIFAISSFLCSISPTEFAASGLIIFRFTQGIGDAMIMASSLVLLSRKWNPEQRGESFGLFLFAGYLGYISGLLGGGSLIDLFGWKASFLFTVPLTVITGLAGYMISKSDKTTFDTKTGNFDFRGMLLFGPAIILLTIGLSQIPSTISIPIILTGIIIFIMLIIHEKQIEYPLFDISIFKNNNIFSLAILSDLLYYAGIGAISYTLSTYLETARDFSSFNVALIILPISISQGFLSPISGKLSDRIDPKYISAAGVGIVFIMLLIYSQLDLNTEIIKISLIAALIGIGFALFSAPNKNAIMSSVNSDNHGNASGIANTFEQTGNLASIGIAAAIMTFISGSSISGSYSPEILLESIDLIFLVLAGICLINILVILIREKSGIKN